MLSELPETWRGKVRHSTQLTTSSTWQIQLTRRRETTQLTCRPTMSAPGWDSLSRCAATDESTPPDMATTTRLRSGVLSRILREEENILRPREAVDAILPPPVALFREEILWRAAVKVKVTVKWVPLICSRFPMARQARSSQKQRNAAAADLPCRLGNRQRKQPWWRYYRTSRRTCPKASAAARRGS